MSAAGNKGEKVHSDCYITLELTNSNGIDIELKSKVKAMYGKSITKLVNNILSFFGIKNAKLVIEDTGALPFVIAARLEAAIKQVINTDKEYLTDFIKENQYHTTRDINRRTRLYLPGNTPNLMINAGIYSPDGVVLDLEDSVAPNKKKEACFLVRNALDLLNFYGAERMVRINRMPEGLEDLEYIIPHNVNLIIIPKCECREQILHVNQKINELMIKHQINYDVWLMPIIETALGVIKAYEIASSSNKVVAMAIGLEDYTADMGVKRTFEATESFFARSMIVTACRAAQIQSMDSVFSDVADMKGLSQNVLMSKALGFEGMGCIHPRQLKVIHENFASDKEETEKAKKIVIAYEEAKALGLGIVSVGTKMTDPLLLKEP